MVSKYFSDDPSRKTLVPIEDIRKGDHVWSYNFSSKRWEARPVLETFKRHYEGDVATIYFGNDKLHVTGGHPFWVLEGENLSGRPPCDVLPACDQGITPEGRWVYARYLQEGDVVRSQSGMNMILSGIGLEIQEAVVYNFAVESLHNYAVSRLELLVHNTNGPGKSDAPENISKDARREPKNDVEKAALEKIKNDPSLGKEVKQLRGKLKDTNFATDFWVKMEYKEGKVVIHYVMEIFTRTVKDFKFKNPQGQFMRVKCIYTKHSDVPELIEKYGYYPNSVNYITIGKEYLVYAIVCGISGASCHDSMEYFIKDDLDDVSSYSVKLFETTNSRLGNEEWHFTINPEGMGFMLGYSEFVRDYEHYERIVDRNEPDRQKFLEWSRMIDQNNPPNITQS